MTPAARAQRMLAALPLALQGGKNLGAVLRTIAEELALAESGVTRLLRSRWYAINRGWDSRDAEVDVKAASELGALADLFGLEPAAGETTDHFRRRLRDVIVLHRAGLTTAPALLQMAAYVYLSDEPPVITWEADDVAVATFTVTEPGVGPRPVRLELIDNPRKSASAVLPQVNPGDRFTITNQGFDPAIPEFILTARGGSVAVPVITQLDTDLRIIWVGKLEPGQELTLRHEQLPLVDGRPVAAPVVVVNPYTYGAPDDYDKDSVFWLEKTIKGVRQTQGARFSVLERGNLLPALPPGPSRWRFDFVPLDLLARYLAYWPDKDELLAADLTGGVQVPPRLEVRWPEVIAACFSLRIPADHVPWHFKGDQVRFTRALQDALARGRAAGIEARLELVQPRHADALDVHDTAPALAVRIDHAEAVPFTEDFHPGGPTIYLEDTIASPDERLSTTGFFDHTAFDTSLYAKPKAEP